MSRGVLDRARLGYAVWGGKKGPVRGVSLKGQWAVGYRRYNIVGVGIQSCRVYGVWGILMVLHEPTTLNSG